MPRRGEYYDDEDDDREIRRRRRPPRRYEEEEDEDDDYFDDEPSSGGKIFPYKNGWALGAYYGSFVSVILVLAALTVGVAVLGEALPRGFSAVAIGVDILGFLLGPIAGVLGIVGMRYAKTHSQAKGGGHAIAGIFIGVLSTLIGIILLVAFVLLLGKIK